MDTHTPTPWTPAMVATWEDGEVMVRWLVSGEYVASGSNRAEATAALRAFGVSPSSVDWAALDAPIDADAELDTDAEPVTPTSRTYAFYVGSTPDYDAHRVPDGHPALRAGISRMGSVENTHGVWAGKRENVAIYRGAFPDDAVAQRVAYAIARMTGNDAVLVTRERSSRDYGVMCANNRFIVRMVTTDDGNRTLFSDFHGGAASGREIGTRLEPDVTGFHVAWLVNADASVSAVS